MDGIRDPPPPGNRSSYFFYFFILASFLFSFAYSLKLNLYTIETWDIDLGGGGG
jgi:hypothetical protein